MKPLVLFGTISVTTALILFTFATIKLLKNKNLTKCMVGVFIAAVVLDLTALICMTLVASHPPFTIHGIIGYSAFALMLIGVVRITLQFSKDASTIPGNLLNYMKYIFIYWVLAYFTGAFMASMG